MSGLPFSRTSILVDLLIGTSDWQSIPSRDVWEDVAGVNASGYIATAIVNCGSTIDGTLKGGDG